MVQDFGKEIRIVELKKNEPLPKQRYHYVTSGYYDLMIHRESEGWKAELVLRSLEKPWEKNFESQFFEEYVEEPKAFAAELGGEPVGWIELGYHKWNNRMRVWELLVKEEFRGRGIGRLLIECAVRLAKERGARMLVLETQSCNVPAIGFYLKLGFELVGFDSTAYSNDDAQKREVRLELGLRLLSILESDNR
jgi:ribosomal protein S18 acetylase RimI-like enzyme